MNSVPNENIQLKDIQSQVGIYVALISWGMLFATLFLGYAIFRSTAEYWPPMGMERVPLTWPVFSTVIIILSSVAFEFQKSRVNISRWPLTLTLVLSLGFLFSQVQIWSYLKSQGLYAKSGIFPTLIYSFTWIHSAHVVLALAALVWLFFKVGNGNISQEDKKKITTHVGKFWHFLGVIWILMFVTLFIL